MLDKNNSIEILLLFFFKCQRIYIYIEQQNFINKQVPTQDDQGPIRQKLQNKETQK